MLQEFLILIIKKKMTNYTFSAWTTNHFSHTQLIHKVLKKRFFRFFSHCIIGQ